jgi:hypothetical protein
MNSWCTVSLYSHFFSSIWRIKKIWSVVDLLHRNPRWWSPIISCTYGLNLQSRIFDKISPSGSVSPPSHLTSYTPTKSNLYFDTVTREPALNKLLTFQVPSLMTLFRRLCRLSKESVQARASCLCFVAGLFFMVTCCYPHAQPPSWSTAPCQLSAAAYSMYPQLPSIRNPTMRHAAVTRDPPNMDSTKVQIKLDIRVFRIRWHGSNSLCFSPFERE